MGGNSEPKPPPKPEPRPIDPGNTRRWMKTLAGDEQPKGGDHRHGRYMMSKGDDKNGDERPVSGGGRRRERMLVLSCGPDRPKDPGTGRTGYVFANRAFSTSPSASILGASRRAARVHKAKHRRGGNGDERGKDGET